MRKITCHRIHANLIDGVGDAFWLGAQKAKSQFFGVRRAITHPIHPAADSTVGNFSAFDDCWPYRRPDWRRSVGWLQLVVLGAARGHYRNLLELVWRLSRWILGQVSSGRAAAFRLPCRPYLRPLLANHVDRGVRPFSFPILDRGLHDPSLLPSVLRLHLYPRCRPPYPSDVLHRRRSHRVPDNDDPMGVAQCGDRAS